MHFSLFFPVHLGPLLSSLLPCIFILPLKGPSEEHDTWVSSYQAFDMPYEMIGHDSLGSLNG